MHPRISVSAICTNRWTVEEDLAFWEREGITNVGVSYRKLGRDLLGSAERIRDSGVRVTNVLAAGGFTLNEPSRWPEQQDRALALVEASRTMEAECLVLTTGPLRGLTWEQGAEAFEQAMAPILRSDQPIAIEHTNSLRSDIGFVHTLHDAIDLARRLGIGVCMETNACFGERGLGDTIAAGVDRIALVQISDFVLGTLGTPDRAVPGDGDIPFPRIVDQLLEAGYEGFFDLELIGPRIEEEGYESAVRRSVSFLEGLLGG
jgi:sugar phosphate isomerase/epimerase